jgi:RNA polymerase sigma factor (sigma-70 family)
MSENGVRGFDLLFDEHRRAVLAYALRRVDDPADAADALAETFLVAWRRLDDVPTGADAKPWLLAVARRVLSNQCRGARRRLGLADRLAQELSAYRPAVPTESDLLVRRALAGLSEADREVLLLSAWEGLTPAEIGAVVGIRAVSVRSRLHRARRRLRSELEALGWDGAGRARAAVDLVPERTR